MSYANDREAFCLANTYGFSPPRAHYPYFDKVSDPGKYEPDDKEGAAERVMLIAHWRDKTNILIKYEPFELDCE